MFNRSTRGVLHGNNHIPSKKIGPSVPQKSSLARCSFFSPGELAEPGGGTMRKIRGDRGYDERKEEHFLFLAATDAVTRLPILLPLQFSWRPFFLSREITLSRLESWKDAR